MDEEQNFIKPLFKTVRDYLEAKIDSVHLKIVDKASDGISSIFSILIIFVIVVFALTALNIGVAIWLGTLMGELWYGFLAVGGFYTLVVIALLTFGRKWMKGVFSDLLINNMLIDDYEN